MSTYTRWYRDGSVTLTKGSNAVVGVNTYWMTAGLNPGDIFKVDGVDYEIVSITDNTHLTIAGNYTGTTGSDKAYAIVRNFTATMPSKIASQTSELLGDFAKYIDTDMQSIHGKSAYQIACEKGFTGTESEWVQSLKGYSAYDVAVSHGYTGTEEEWLLSLKAAGEISDIQGKLTDLDALADSLGVNRLSIKNTMYTGRNLGAFTENHLAVIKDGTFTGLGLGDYFVHNNKKYIIAGFRVIASGGKYIVLWRWDALGRTEFEFPFDLRQSSLAQYSGEICYNEPAIGTEGEEGYLPSTLGNPYATSFWYTYARPKFIELIESIFGADNVISFGMTVPTKEYYAADAGTVLLSSKAHLMNHNMFKGENILQNTIRNGLGFMDTTHGQLPLFKANPAIAPVGNEQHFALAELAKPEVNGAIAAGGYNYTWVNAWVLLAWHQRLKPIFLVG